MIGRRVWMWAGVAALWIMPLTTMAQQGAPQARELPGVLQTDRDKASYGLGADLARRFAAEGMDLNLELLVQGFKDATAKSPLKVTPEEFQQAIVRMQREAVTKVATKNLEEGNAYLAKNKARAGVKTLPSGLQYEVVQQGKGASPKPTDTVKAHYRGTFISGDEFDSSLGGEPLEIKVNEVIPGWTEALQLMKPGDKWKLVIPPALGYGPQGVPPDIGPNSVLLFDIELVEVVPAAGQ
ncbi:MAG: FKBP-type peptidyl-prolyl cis-trans isomerase [Pirellulales bacterium]